MSICLPSTVPYTIDPLALAYAFDVHAFTEPGAVEDLPWLAAAFEVHPSGSNCASVLYDYEQELRAGEIQKARYQGHIIATLLREKAKFLGNNVEALLPPNRSFLFATPVQARARATSFLKIPGVDFEPEVAYPGRYQILDKILESGYYDIWLAFDSVLRDVVVIKSLALDRNTDPFDADQQLRNEFDVGHRFNHPAVIQYLDWGDDFTLASEGKEGEWRKSYLVMEYIGRLTLGLLFAKRKELLSWEEAKEILLQLLSALEMVHREGFVHGDLKPGNIVVSELGGKIFVKLIDFGLAIREKDCSERGTPIYIAPEHIRREPLDQRTDIYSLGVIMFQMLTGVVPFSAATKYELYRLHQFQLPPFFQQVVPDLRLPEGVEAIVRKALVKDPADRFQSTAEMAEAIRSCK